MNMNRLIKNTVFLTVFVFSFSCTSYLDVVPDNVRTIEDVFKVKADAWSALAKVYSYIPSDAKLHTSDWMLGDEYLGRLDYISNDGTQLCGMKIMQGNQSATTPLLGMWSGTGGGVKLYEGIRQCNVFLANIHLVNDMSESEIANWSAQVKFLKAYYLFLLIQKYGPIVIPDDIITPDATLDKLFLPRLKVEDCFKYVIDLINEAIPQLEGRASLNDLGQVDKAVAVAIKARVLLFRASPFYSGNREYFGDFYDHDGQPFFPMDDAATTKNKWKEALDAIDEAIRVCRELNVDMYTYEKAPFLYDTASIRENPERMQTLYDLRMVVVDPWNKELIWGFSNISYGDGGGDDEIAYASAVRSVSGYQGYESGTGFNWQWLAATYRMTERYYTKNGLPIDEDVTFDISVKHDITTTPDTDSAAYKELNGILQPNAELINLYLNRELRFYANLGITGGYWRGHTFRMPTRMFGSDTYPYVGGYNSSFSMDYLNTGIGIQKFVHPESKAYHTARVIKFPYPIIRLADLYLMKAEALNEYLDAPTQEVYDAVNVVRQRAGIPNVETVWADATLVKTLNKHKTKDGMRDIILQERSIELAFEGSHFWDMLRHKRAPAEFSTPIWGWTHTGSNASSFFNLGVKHSRRFQVRDCLWPISIDEMNTNSRLIQNPGW
jgi:hypothetical protein